MSIIKADPRRRRQLPLTGPLIFWRTGRDGTSKEALVVVGIACQNPDCPCRDVNLMVYRVDGRLVGVNCTKDAIEFSFPKLGEGDDGSQYERALVLLADLDLDTGCVVIAKNAPAAQRDEVALSWLREELDGPVLDHLSDCVLRQKGMRPFALLDVKNFERGKMVAFNETYLHGRIDTYSIDGRRLDVLDLYCIDPSCACTEIRFWTLCNRREMGCICVDLAGKAPPRFEGDRVLAKLWQAIQVRYPSLDVFRKRETKMKEAGPGILAQSEAQRRVPSPVISRNQPCPCGSGKKYKRCCIGKTVPRPTI
jgi:hypothetical protein